jgi:hypothetical protein
MSCNRRILVLFFVLIMISGNHCPVVAGNHPGEIAVAGTSVAPELACSKDPLLEKAAALKESLKNKGYRVRGRLDYNQYVELDFIKLYCDGKIDSCNGNNSTNRYLTALVPPLPTQAETDLPFLFRIRRNEAVVLVGPTPPPCDYFSYVCLLFSRYDKGWGPNDTRKIFSSLGDPLNRFILKTGGGDFDQDIVLVFTSDKKTNDAIKKAAMDAGFPKSVFNTFVIPSSLLRTNHALDKTTDELVIGTRTALWRDGTSDGGGYIENPGVVVFRVTPPDRNHDPFPTPLQMVRGTGRTEFDIGPSVEKLREAILKRYSNLSAQEHMTTQWVMQSPIALQTMTNTLGDSSDAAYLITEQPFKLSDSPDDFLVIYGVNHKNSGKAVYHNIIIYQAYKYCGIASAYDHCYGPECVAFAGSAAEYLSNKDTGDIDQLYALKVARNCNGEPYCLEVPIAGCGKGTELDDDMHVGFRAYIEPESKSGPAYTELLFDRVVHFTAPPPVLELDSKIVESHFPDPAEVSFKVSSTTPGDIRWEAEVEYVDDVNGARIEPNQGVISGGQGKGSFKLTGDHPGSYSLKITVKDQQSRFAADEVRVLIQK